jgi:hypothetical protein
VRLFAVHRTQVEENYASYLTYDEIMLEMVEKRRAKAAAASGMPAPAAAAETKEEL